mgnify:CR=1 FL=1
MFLRFWTGIQFGCSLLSALFSGSLILSFLEARDRFLKGRLDTLSPGLDFLYFSFSWSKVFLRFWTGIQFGCSLLSALFSGSLILSFLEARDRFLKGRLDTLSPGLDFLYFSFSWSKVLLLDWNLWTSF